MPNTDPKAFLILIVEDQALVRVCICEQLEDAGFGVIEAADAEEALISFETHAGVTTLFTDINMPGALDGVALAHKIFSLRPEVQLILTSGRAQPAAHTLPPGARFLAKPYHCKGLTDLIKAA